MLHSHDTVPLRQRYYSTLCDDLNGGFQDGKVGVKTIVKTFASGTGSSIWAKGMFHFLGRSSEAVAQCLCNSKAVTQNSAFPEVVIQFLCSSEAIAQFLCSF